MLIKSDTIIVSRCLLGEPCRWHGKAVPCSSYVKRYLKENLEIKVIPVCPEILGGLPIPRPPVKRRHGHVYETCANKSQRKNITGKDVTKSFVAGAKKTLDIALKHKVRLAILCRWSPSCDETGITGKLLFKHGIVIKNTW